MVWLIIWLFLFIFSVAFILFQAGYWAFLDVSFLPFIQYADFQSLFSPLINVLSNNVSVLGESTMFGFDFSERMSTTFVSYFFLLFFIKIFWAKFGYILFLGFASFLIFYFSQKIISNYFSDKKNSIIFALLATFNPVSLWLYNESIILLAYAGIFISTYFFIEIYKNLNYKNVLWLAFWWYFLFAYPRILLIFLFFVFFWILFWWYKYVLNFWKKYKFKIIPKFLLLVLLFAPFWVIIFYKLWILWTPNSSNFSNYLTLWMSKVEGFYYGMKWNWFFNSLLPINYYPSNFSISVFFKIISIIFIYWWILLYFLTKNKKNILLSFWIIFCIFLKTSAYFLDLENFTLLNYKIFSFQANTLAWIDVCFVVLIAFLWFLNLKNNKKLIIFPVSILCLWLIEFWFYPLYSQNGYLKNIQIPNEYEKIMQENSLKPSQGYISYPAHNQLIFKDYTYPLWMTNTSYYNTIFSNNSRFVSLGQSEFYNYILLDFYKIKNILKPLWLTSIMISKQVSEEDKEILYYEKPKNLNLYNSLTELYLKQWWEVKEKNDFFEIFEKKWVNNLVYSPNRVFYADDNILENIWEVNNKLTEKDLLSELDNKNINFNSSILFEKNRINDSIYPVQMEVFYDKNKPYYYYLKIKNTEKKFLVQLNKTFDANWKMYFIEKKSFENSEKISDFYETRNSFYKFSENIFSKPNGFVIDEEYHFEWNFVGNAWLVKPENIPENMKNNEELYTVIIYEKQIWYNWALLISGLTFGILLILTIFQEIKNFKNRKNEK